MTSLTEAFDERLREIEAYLDLLEAFDRQLKKKGPPKIGGGPITAQQQKILYSAVYLQLYNLVEVTVTRCVDAVRAAASENDRWTPADLSKQLREEWASLKAATNIPLNQDNRRQRAVDLCEHLVHNLPVTWPDGVMTRGGNWDDDQIEKMSARLGCELQISTNASEAVKRPIRDEKGPLKLIKDRRNGLAHGSLSFEECGADVTIEDLRKTKDCAVLYLTEVVAAFSCHIDAYEFLSPERRPSVGLAG